MGRSRRGWEDGSPSEEEPPTKEEEGGEAVCWEPSGGATAPNCSGEEFIVAVVGVWLCGAAVW